MRLVVLTENTAINEDFFFEHGLSLYIEACGKKILFDCGQSDVFLKNAKKIGIDLSAVDFAVISHGHYDHGGGLAAFTEINKTAEIFINKNAFSPHYSSSTGVDRYIGLDTSLQGNPRFVMTDEIYAINEDFSLICADICEEKYAVDHSGLKMQGENGLCDDDFRHEQYLCFKDKGRKVIISGCSHKGILNIMNMTKPDILVGGFHFMRIDPKTDSDMLIKNAEQLKSYGAKYYTCHCTGAAQFDVLKKVMNDELTYIPSGLDTEV